MTQKKRKEMVKDRQISWATWIFGGLLLFFLIAVFILAPESLPEFKHKLLALFSALLSALFGFFLTGDITLKFEITKKSKLGKLAVKAAGGFALFVLVLWWWTTPLAPAVLTVDQDIKTTAGPVTGVNAENGNALPDSVDVNQTIDEVKEGGSVTGVNLKRENK
jgi:hypothetical protein